MSELKYKRILLKLSGEALLGNRSYGIDPEVCDYLSSEIAKIKALGAQIVIVLGGGNIFRGISAEKHGMNRATGDYLGMLATVMNALALGDSLAKAGVENRVQSAIDMPKVCEPYIRKRAIRHLEKGRVVIACAGSGNPYFTTDTAAAIRACELDCDIIFKATKVEGVYDADPEKDKNAKMFSNLSYLEVINNNYHVMDNTAITLCMDNKIKILVFKMSTHDNILKAALGEKLGTIIN